MKIRRQGPISTWVVEYSGKVFISATDAEGARLKVNSSLFELSLSKTMTWNPFKTTARPLTDADIAEYQNRPMVRIRKVSK